MKDTPPSAPEPPDHAWVHDRLAAALLGGLSAEEQSRFDAHINSCPECFDDFTDAKAADRDMQRALSALSPSPDFEQTLLQNIREKTMPKPYRLLLRRAGIAIAAAVALAATGVFAQYAIRSDTVTAPLSERLVADDQSQGITLPDFWGERRQSASAAAVAPRERYIQAATKMITPNVRGIVQSKIVYGGKQQAYWAHTSDSNSPQLKDMLPKNARLLQANAELSRKVNEDVTARKFADESIDKLQTQLESQTDSPKQFAQKRDPVNESKLDYYKPALALASQTDDARKLSSAAMKDRESIQSGTSAPFDIAEVPVANVAAGERDGVELPTDVKGDVQKPPAQTGQQMGDSEHRVPQETSHLARPPSPAATQPAADIAPRKIIRNGSVEFEVRSFDDASATISAVVTEESGFVSSTSSDKLANGKIRGTIVVRVPPDHLDRTLLKLRSLGDLKTQQISANDVTKEYTDIDSELRALRAMESRLIDLIKNGKGDVKDLVVAEKQLGDYRVRIEKLEGDERYYNNLVGMATLSIVLYEKDIQKPTAASESEQVTLALETDDVETKYNDARKILDDAKGRIVDSELKKYDADQFTASIVVDVPPDKADFVAAQLKQIGTVANYTRDRKQTTTGGSGAPTVQVQQEPARFTITLYNLANVAPREVTVLTVAVRDVDATYRKIIGLVRQPAPIGNAKNLNEVPPRKPVGRVITSDMSGQSPQQMTADIRADVQATEAPMVLQAIQDSGEVITSTSTENADTANTTSSKRGIQLRLVNAAAVPARETQTLRAVADDVADSYNKLLIALQAPAVNAGIRIIASQLTQTDPRTVTASLSFEAARSALPAVDKAFADAGINFLARNVVRSNDAANTLDSKVLFQIDSLIPTDSLPPRLTTILGVEVPNVEKALDSLRSSLSPGNVREIEYNVTTEATGRVTGHLVVETPVANAMAVLSHIKDLGGVEKVNQVMKDNQVPDAPFARERIDLTLTSPAALVENGKGFAATIRAALASSAAALLLSLYYVITGTLFLGPFLIVIWIIYRLTRRRPAKA